MRWTNISTGDMREKIEIWRRVTTKDEYGHDRETFVLRARVRAMVRQAVNRPVETLDFALRQITSKNPSEVYVRYRDDVRVTDRIEWDGRTLNIEAVFDPEAGRRRWLVLYATEVQR